MVVDVKVEGGLAMSIPCGQWISGGNGYRSRDCAREGLWTDRTEDQPVEHRSVYCNVHKAGVMRRIYGRYTMRALTSDERKKVYKEVKDRREQQAKYEAERREAERIRQEEIHARWFKEAWEANAQEASYVSKVATNWNDKPKENEWDYSVGINPVFDSFRSFNFTLKAEGEDFPLVVRFNSTGTFTPNEAIALSNALREAAAKAAILNEKRKP